MSTPTRAATMRAQRLDTETRTLEVTDVLVPAPRASARCRSTWATRCGSSSSRRATTSAAAWGPKSLRTGPELTMVVL